MLYFFERGSEQIVWDVRRATVGYEIAVHGDDSTHVLVASTATELLDEMVSGAEALRADAWRPTVADPLLGPLPQGLVQGRRDNTRALALTD
jgi:hypothetical protein